MEADRKKMLQLDLSQIPIKKSTPVKNDELVGAAQEVSNSYNRGSIAGPKFFNFGKTVAR